MDQAQNITTVLARSGLSLPQLCSMLSREITDSALFRLSDTDHAEYCRLFAIFDNSRRNNDRTKGAALEGLASFLLSRLGVYQVLRNKRTSTNEIDVVLNKMLAFSSIGGDVFPDHIICECKNYESSVSVTYVGKFYSLLRVSGVKLGLMISDSRISGRSQWSDGCGLCRKIALRDNTYIVNINYDDLKNINDRNISILKLISDKINSIKLDVTISYVEHELCGDVEFVTIDTQRQQQ